MRGGPIPVVLTIDLEPDGLGQHLEPGGRWDGMARTRAWVDEVRGRAEALSGRPARVSWLVRCDPQIEAVFGSATHLIDAERDLFDDAWARGDEVGVHVHAWRRGPDGSWIDDYGDEAWFGECIDRSFAAFERGFGRRCRIVSIGNRFFSPATAERLSANGAAIDLTGEPANAPVADGGWDRVTGLIPDYRRMPRGPHRLTPTLVELPLTASRKRLGRRPRAHLSRMRRHGIRQRLDHPVQLGGKEVPGVGFGELMADTLRLLGSRAHLSFAVRSDGLLDPVQRPRVVGHMDAVLALPEAERYWFATPSEAVEALGVE